MTHLITAVLIFWKHVCHLIGFKKFQSHLLVEPNMFLQIPKSFSFKDHHSGMTATRWYDSFHMSTSMLLLTMPQTILQIAICSTQKTMCAGWINKKAYLASFIHCFSPAGGKAGSNISLGCGNLSGLLMLALSKNANLTFKSIPILWSKNIVYKCSVLYKLYI